MIKIYSMNTCPDCIYVEEQIHGDDRYEIIDIGSHVKNLKEFLRIRDNSPVFNEAKKVGAAGIPCFVLEDGSVTLIPEEAGLTSRPITEGMSCNIDGSGSDTNYILRHLTYHIIKLKYEICLLYDRLYPKMTSNHKLILDNNWQFYMNVYYLSPL